MQLLILYCTAQGQQTEDTTQMVKQDTQDVAHKIGML